MWTSFQGCINDNIPATSEESYIKMSFLVSTYTQSYRDRHNIIDWTYVCLAKKVTDEIVATIALCQPAVW